MNGGPRTIEEARALREAKEWELIEGPLSSLGFDGDAICFFVDADGRGMRVEAIGDEYVKVRVLV